ncbi:hypothetical protein J0A68_01125 [Algoriphagus sp. H41]|uniref:Tetratricopeptide repeat-containing protein n=1 Tax=Algoriphagus oliviformis TaxID=2811231 RepID=A0ABS3C069_9BACT|nr:hypothetical protein [Algoriphagus oliviformis]MBN7809536.1 hypothetical protein [Algoriphagus oliviformis]
MVNKLTAKQKVRLRELEPRLDDAINKLDIIRAKEIVLELQQLLRPTGHLVRLCQSKNKLYELAINLGEYDLALSGLKSNKIVLNDNTRIYLESISLLAICYIRKQDIENAKPFIKEVLLNEKVIKSQRKREAFHSEIINRFNEEVALCSLKSPNKAQFDEVEIEKEVIKIIQNLNESEIFAELGNSTPNSTKELIYLVHDFSLKQLPYTERKALPSPDQKIENEEMGKTIFHSIKRVIHNSLCNPESEIYKVWYNGGARMVLNKGYIRTSILTCLADIGIGATFLAASIIALVIKFGIEVYCNLYEPIGLMDIRGK